VIAVRSPGDVAAAAVAVGVAAAAAVAVGVAAAAAAVVVLANDNNTSRSPNWFVRISQPVQFAREGKSYVDLCQMPGPKDISEETKRPVRICSGGLNED